MRQDDDLLGSGEAEESENIWHRSLLGLFLTVVLLIVGGFGLSMWELRHDQEITAMGNRR